MDKKALFTQIWKEVLGVTEAGDSDNFFEAGGDSVKGMQLIGKLAQKGLKLDMLKLYTEPTVEQLVDQIEETEPVNLQDKMKNRPGMPPFAPNAAPAMPPQPAPMPYAPMPYAPMPYAPVPAYYIMVPVYMPQMMPAPQMDMPQPMPAPMAAPPMAAPQFGPATRSPEDTLDAVLSEIFPEGYDKQVNLFEQGLDSLKMMQIVTRCGQQGYRINLQEIMKDPTFKGIVAIMKTE